MPDSEVNRLTLFITEEADTENIFSHALLTDIHKPLLSITIMPIGEVSISVLANCSLSSVAFLALISSSLCSSRRMDMPILIIADLRIDISVLLKSLSPEQSSKPTNPQHLLSMRIGKIAVEIV